MASVPAELLFIERGIVSYHDGYSVAEDIAWDAVMYLVALAAYATLRRRATAQEQPHEP